MARPSFQAAWARFQDIRLPVSEVGRKLGGNVQRNVDSGIFQNACPIRMSYVLNGTGLAVPNAGPYAVVSGADRNFYMYRVNDMIKYLEAKLGPPDKTVKAPTTSDFAGLKGILVVKGSGWSNAVGHVTLWNGSICSDSCHLASDPDNGSFVPEIGHLWELP